MSETHEGVCHICGKHCKLTFEHILLGMASRTLRENGKRTGKNQNHT